MQSVLELKSHCKTYVLYFSCFMCNKALHSYKINYTEFQTVFKKTKNEHARARIVCRGHTPTKAKGCPQVGWPLQTGTIVFVGNPPSCNGRFHTTNGSIFLSHHSQIDHLHIDCTLVLQFQDAMNYCGIQNQQK